MVTSSRPYTIEILEHQACLNQKASPHLNCKVNLSYLTDHMEFYQLLTYKDDDDLLKKLNE